MKKIFFKNARGLRLCGILDEPNSKKEEIVIIVHGFSSNKDGSTKEISIELARRNINSFRIDLSGSGESEGKFEDKTVTGMRDDLFSAIEFVKSRGYNKIDLFGYSCGGIVCIAAALIYRGINKIALKSPVLDYVAQRTLKYGKDEMKKWKQKGYNYYLRKGKKLRVNYSFIEDAKKYVMYEKIKKIACPLLIIHGDKDEEVPVEQSRRLMQNYQNPSFLDKNKNIKREIAYGILLVLKGANHALEVNGDRSPSNRIFADYFEKGISIHPKNNIPGIKYYI